MKSTEMLLKLRLTCVVLSLCIKSDNKSLCTIVLSEQITPI